MATASVLTLLPREERAGADSSARRLLLEEQLAEASLHFFGIQEARSPQAELRAGRKYVMGIGAADPGGNLGVELWISGDLHVNTEHIFVLDTSPRLLVVKLV